MFNDDFYPTPQGLTEKALDKINWKMVFSILEPSAGKGNILDEIVKNESIYNPYYDKYSNESKFDIDCIEKDVNLQSVLKGKKYRLVHDDFLTFDTYKQYDLIIMNPPFSNGCKHLLKAISMQERDGGQIVCILNAETIKNPFSNERKDLLNKLNEYHAKIDFLQNEFVGSERSTNVEIVLIYINIPRVQKTSFIVENLQKAKEVKEHEYSNNNIIERDFLKNIIQQHQFEIESGLKLIDEYLGLEPYILASFDHNSSGEVIQKGECILNLSISGTDTLSKNEYIKRVRSKYWRALFKNDEFIGLFTNNLQREFYNNVAQLEDYDFTMYNILSIKNQMNQQIIRGVEETILNLFEELSHKHHWFDETSKNIHFYNGWKTNKAWKINKKVIIPLNGYYDLEYSWGGFRPTRKDVIDKLKDIEKCFNYLDGGLTQAIDLRGALEFAEEFDETKNIQLKYFNVTFYKKGTCHIVFTNDELLKKFNIFGSQKKGWLPPSYGNKQYKDMTQEEKNIIDDFEGEQEYKKTVANTQYYIFNSNQVLMLNQ